MTSTQKHHRKAEDITGEAHTALKNLSIVPITNHHGSKISELMHLMRAVKTDTPEAKANEASMSDNNGKRIKYRRGKSHHK